MQRLVVRSPEEESKGSPGRVRGLTDIPRSQYVSQAAKEYVLTNLDKIW